MAVAGTLTYKTELDTKEMQSGFNNIISAAKSTMAKIGTTLAVGKLVKDSVGAIAQYEQQVGRSSKIIRYRNCRC